MSAPPDGRLLIGFRNRFPAGSAAGAMFESEAVIQGQAAKFGEPITP